jgi:hypothetical protein
MLATSDNNSNNNNTPGASTGHSKALFDAVVLATTEALRGHDSRFSFRVGALSSAGVIENNSGKDAF